MAKRKLSVYVLTYNNEDTIERCLKSVLWVDEIVVVDHFSRDQTPEICRRYATKFFQKQWTNYRDEYNFAASLTSNEWLMFLDSDEEVPLELAREIQEELGKEDHYVGYKVPRMTFYLGRWIRHGGWYPDYKLRIYRRDRGKWQGETFDPKVVVDGPVKKLKNPCLHYSFRDLEDHLERMNLYSGLFARTKRKRGPLIVNLLVRPMFRFLRNYLLKGGFLDGIPGLIAATMSSYYVFLKYAKTWELQNVKPPNREQQ